MAKPPTSSVVERKTSGSTEIGAALRQARERHELSQEAFGAHLGVSKSAVSQWESGAVAIDIRHVPAISVLLGIPIASLAQLPDGAEFLSGRERLLMRKFRQLSPERQESLLALLPGE